MYLSYDARSLSPSPGCFVDKNVWGTRHQKLENEMGAGVARVGGGGERSEMHTKF
jgi:hypothetical protein